MIFIPKYTDIHGEITVPPVGIRGDYRIKKYDINMRLIQDTGWVKNLITDFGMLSMTTDAGFSAFTYISSSITQPSVADTQIDGFLAAVSALEASDRNPVPVAPFYEKWNQVTRRFLAGVGTGSINKVGLGSNLTGGELFSSQLVSPTVEKLADNIVDVIWRITKFPNLIDVNGTAVLDSITYDTILRPLDVATHGDASGTFAQVKAYNSTSNYQVSDQNLVPYTDTALAAITDNASEGGTDGPSGWVTPNTVAYRDMYHTWPLNDANLVNGIRTMSFRNTGPVGIAQCQFTAQGGGNETIPKDETKQLDITWRVSWERRP